MHGSQLMMSRDPLKAGVAEWTESAVHTRHGRLESSPCDVINRQACPGRCSQAMAHLVDCASCLEGASTLFAFQLQVNLHHTSAQPRRRFNRGLVHMASNAVGS